MDSYMLPLFILGAYYVYTLPQFIAFPNSNFLRPFHGELQTGPFDHNLDEGVNGRHTTFTPM